jgi:hypothetical protein
LDLWRTGHFRPSAILDHQATRGDQRGNLRVAELAEQAPYVAIQWFGPGLLPAVEIAAHQASVDAWVDGRRVKCQQPTFAVAGHADARRARPRGKPIDRRQNLGHFVADQVPAHVVGLAMDPFAMRLVGVAHRRMARPLVGPIHQHGHEDLAAELDQAPCPLRLLGDARLQPDELFGRLVGVGQGHHPGLGFADGIEQQPFAVDALEHGPAYLPDLVLRRHAQQCRAAIVAEAFHACCDARIDETQDLHQPFAIRLHRTRIGRGRRQVAFPVLRTLGRRGVELALDETVQAVHHPVGQVVVPGQRFRARQRDHFGGRHATEA